MGAGAFQSNAFQNDAFQVDEYPSGGPVIPAPDPEGFTLLIDGVEWFYHTTTLDITEQIGGRNMMRLEVFSLTGAARPVINKEVIFVRDGERIFAGNIEDVEEVGIGGEYPHPGLSFQITVVDFNALASRRYAILDFPQQQLILSLYSIENYLTPYGVTLDPAQVGGPIMPAIVYDTKPINEILDDLCSIASTLTGPPQAVVWEIDYNKVLRVWGVLDSGHTAPFNIPGDPSILIGAPRVRPTKTDYANYIHLLFGTGRREIVDIVATGDGVHTSWALHYNPYDFTGGGVNVGGTLVDGVITGGTLESIGVASESPTWVWERPGNTITRATPPALGELILMKYEAIFPGHVVADGFAPLSELVEKAFSRDDIFDIAVAQPLADSLLLGANRTFREIVYRTRVPGCHPGQVQTITLAEHSVSGIHLITEVRIDDRAETELQYEIKAVAGTDALPESWMALYQLWSKTGGASGTSSAIGTVATPVARQSFYLGGNATLYVQSAGPDWIAADAVRAVIDTSVRGTTLGRVYARLRATAGSVTARLRNVTDGITVGTSGPVTDTAWQDVEFDAVLTAGTKTYELQVLPSLANTDVAATGNFV